MQSTSFIEFLCYFKISSSSCQVSSYNNLFTIQVIINFLLSCQHILKSLCRNFVFFQRTINSVSLLYTFTKNENRSFKIKHLFYSGTNMIGPLFHILEHRSKLYLEFPFFIWRNVHQTCLISLLKKSFSIVRAKCSCKSIKLFVFIKMAEITYKI